MDTSQDFDSYIHFNLVKMKIRRGNLTVTFKLINNECM